MDSIDPIIQRAQELLRRSGKEPRQVQKAGHGSHHHLFVVELDDGPLKLLRMPREEVIRRISPALRAEAEAIEHAHETLPVPHPVELLPTPERPEGCLMPILPGTRATDLRSRGHVDVSRICMELGRSLARLHGIRRRDDQPSAIRTLLEEHSGDRPCLLHGDAHLGNLLVEREKRGGWKLTGIVDWSFCAWGPPEIDLVEMAICDAEPRPHLGRVFYESYIEAGGLPPRESVFRAALLRELERRLQEHAQAYDLDARDTWTRWYNALQRPDAVSTRIFDVGRPPGRSLA
jgi:aminoglycoside phosphotransferase (APT) family kinase protein